MNFLIKVEKDGEILEIHPSTLRAHMAAGWIEKKEVKASESEETQPQPKPAQPKPKKG